MQFSPAKALLSGMAQLWYVWLILGLVLIGKLVFYLLEQQKLARSGIADIDRMDGKTFEKYLKVFFEKLGYKVERTRYIGDYGADLVTTNNGVKMVIQAKRYKNKVGIKAVQEAVASKGYYNCDGIVKSRHSRENGNPENSNYMKILDSCLRRNDRK